jgi:TetR/AcrR family transcriptional repressor of nem operon
MTAQTRHEMGPKERLVAGAMDLLHTQSYPSVGVQALCDLAGVRKGSFYHFFASKEDLILAALNEAWETFRADVVEPALLRETTREARNAAIRRSCHPVGPGPLATSSGAGCIFGRVAASITDSEPLLRARLAEIFTEWAAMLGDGGEGWASLADIQGRLLLGFTVEVPETVQV